MRILENNPQTLSATFYDDDTPLDVGDVTVTVKNLDGLVVSTGAASPGSQTGEYTYGLPAQDTKGILTVFWEATGREVRQKVEVVGNHIFTLQEARNSDEIMAVGSRRNYSAQDIKEQRESVEVEFEQITGRSFVPRRVTEVIDVLANGVGFLSKYDIREVVSINGDEDFTNKWTDSGRIEGLSGDKATVVYEYGYTYCPEDVKRAGLLRLRYNLGEKSSNIPLRATSMSVEGNTTYSLATPGRAGSETGIPDVDAVLNRYKVNTMSGVW